MAFKRFCAIFAGIADLVYALASTGVVGYILVQGIRSLLFVGGGGSTENAAVGFLGLIFTGPFILVFFILALLLVGVPCVGLWITSVGLIKAGAKKQLPSGYGMGSAVMNGLVILVCISYMIAAATDSDGGAGGFIALIVVFAVFSGGLIALSLVAASGRRDAQMRRYTYKPDLPPADGSRYYYNGDGGYNAYTGADERRGSGNGSVRQGRGDGAKPAAGNGGTEDDEGGHGQ